MREAHISRILPCYWGVQIENIPTSGEGSLPRLMSRIFRKWTEHKIALVDSAELRKWRRFVHKPFFNFTFDFHRTNKKLTLFLGNIIYVAQNIALRFVFGNISSNINLHYQCCPLSHLTFKIRKPINQ